MLEDAVAGVLTLIAVTNRMSEISWLPAMLKDAFGEVGTVMRNIAKVLKRLLHDLETMLEDDIQRECSDGVDPNLDLEVV